MNPALQPVSYATPQPPIAGRLTRSRFDFETTLETLRQAIQQEDLWVIHEINPQMLLERGGYALLPARQLLFFHPRYLVQVLAEDPAALIEAPLKVAVMALPDGAVAVRSTDVAADLSRYAGLAPLGTELATLVARVVASIA